MADPEYLDGPEGRRLAYHRSAGAGPGVVFLGGRIGRGRRGGHSCGSIIPGTGNPLAVLRMARSAIGQRMRAP